MKRLRFLGIFLIIGLVFTLLSCTKREMKDQGTMTEKPAAETQKPMGNQQMAQKSLYERLGGEPAITAVVDQFIANVLADERINKRFARTTGERAQRFRTNLINQIGEATGGPQKYTGLSMKAAHAGMGITTAEFNALVEDLVAALNKFNVPEKEKSELLAILAPMQKDIVEVP